MNSYLFVLGRTPELALIELSALYPQSSRISLHSARLMAETCDSDSLMQRLGGTTKIAKIVGQIEAISAPTLAPFYSGSQSIQFGLSFVDMGVSPTRKLLTSIKRILEERGVRARFIEAKEGSELSSVVVKKQGVEELVVVADGERYIVAKTETVQDFAAWNTRDYGRPESDVRAGMLPPKVARMAVNIAFGTLGIDHPRIYDPFCGMGTILGEAMMIGANVVGSDQSKTAVSKAEKNIEWLKKTYPELSVLESRFFVADATHVSDVLSAASIDAIVTEPFMGDTSIAAEKNLDQKRIANVMKGLEKLYIGSLKEWKKILKPEGVVVIAFPVYRVKGHDYRVKKVVDMCETLGYTRHVGPIEYSRPQATVKRNFYVFVKN